jgi:hypothetical protein
MVFPTEKEKSWKKKHKGVFTKFLQDEITENYIITTQSEVIFTS